MASRRTRDERLARIEASRKRAKKSGSERRRALEAQQALAAVIREGLEERGLDPARAAALSRTERAAATEPDPRAPKDPAQARDPDSGLTLFWARLGRLAERFCEREEPDLARASLAELLAWLLSRH